MLHEQGSPFSSWSEKKEAPFWERVGFPSVVELDILIRQLQTKLRNDRVRNKRRSPAKRRDALPAA
jgi:hypothetical protein